MDEYLDGMLVCRALTHPLVEACLTRLSEVGVNSTLCSPGLTLFQIYTTLAKEYLVTLASLLKALISVNTFTQRKEHLSLTRTT